MCPDPKVSDERLVPNEDVIFPASFYCCTITCLRRESADRDGGVNIGSFFILLQRFVRAEGRADESFWIHTCKLLPPELCCAALGVHHCGQTCPEGRGTATSGTGQKPEDSGSDVLRSQGGPGEEGASRQVKVF